MSIDWKPGSDWLVDSKPWTLTNQCAALLDYPKSVQLKNFKLRPSMKGLSSQAPEVQGRVLSRKASGLLLLEWGVMRLGVPKSFVTVRSINAHKDTSKMAHSLNTMFNCCARRIIYRTWPCHLLKYTPKLAKIHTLPSWLQQFRHRTRRMRIRFKPPDWKDSTGLDGVSEKPSSLPDLHKVCVYNICFSFYGSFSVPELKIFDYEVQCCGVPLML